MPMLDLEPKNNCAHWPTTGMNIGVQDSFFLSNAAFFDAGQMLYACSARCYDPILGEGFRLD